MFKSPTFQKYFLPGFVFQSIIIAGGYGTGRELAEYFLAFGPLGGLLGMVLVSTVIWCVVCAVTFELARQTRSYDYRSFSRQLLGPLWWTYEICYLMMMLIVLSVIAAAAGSIFDELAPFSSKGLEDADYYLGVIFVMAAVGFLVLKGTTVVEKFLSFWSLVLYAVYILFLIACSITFGDDIVAGLASAEIRQGWFVGGVKYAAYNVGILPAVLFSIRHLEARREAFGAGLLAGPIAMLPGLFFFLAMTGRYPGIVDETVPSIRLLQDLGSPLFLYTFQIVLLGTLVETGAGLIHAFNERVASALHEKRVEMASALRPVVAVVLLAAATVIAQVGLEELIATGYGTVTWGFWLVFLLPVLTLGVRRIRRHV